VSSPQEGKNNDSNGASTEENGQEKKEGNSNGQLSRNLITLTATEKDQSLENQIQANNEDYDTRRGSEKGNDDRVMSFSRLAAQDEDDIKEEKENIPSADEASLQQRAAKAVSALPNARSLGNMQSVEPPEWSDSIGEAQRVMAELEIGEPLGPEANYDDIERRLREAAGKSQEQLSMRDLEKSRSQSPASSIDVDSFSETQRPELESPDASSRLQSDREAGNPLAESSGLAASADRANIPSTTKIGDYARIEYSPLEDLESVTTYSRGGSTKGSRSYAGSTLSRQNSMGKGAQRQAMRSEEPESDVGEGPGPLGRSNKSSRRSSGQGGLGLSESEAGGGGGYESTSISIASQLSNEQFQQNLTNLLEQSASPTTMFGTIGLPLGPPLRGGVSSSSLGDGIQGEAALSETGGKTTPETPGAALTSASHDSLSDASLSDIGDGADDKYTNQKQTTNKAATLQSIASSGGALVQSNEDSMELNNGGGFTSAAPLASSEDEPAPSASKRASIQTNETDDQSKASTVIADQRVGSPQSYATTTSGGLTNPTPTPSELSQGSQGKKKKLKAKAVLKRFKFGSKKGKSKGDSVDEPN